MSDAVTDTYGAVEAFFWSFTKSIKVSDHHERLLEDYVGYGGESRHAERPKKPRPKLTEPEVEASVYLTGSVTRLAIRSTREP